MKYDDPTYAKIVDSFGGEEQIARLVELIRHGIKSAKSMVLEGFDTLDGVDSLGYLVRDQIKFKMKDFCSIRGHVSGIQVRGENWMTDFMGRIGNLNVAVVRIDGKGDAIRPSAFRDTLNQGGQMTIVGIEGTAEDDAAIDLIIAYSTIHSQADIILSSVELIVPTRDHRCELRYDVTHLNETKPVNTRQTVVVKVAKKRAIGNA